MANTMKITLLKVHRHLQIEFPDNLPHPPGRRGGRKTSLHLQRGTYRDVTPEELAWIMANEPELYACLKVLPVKQKVGNRARRRLEKAQKAKATARRQQAAKDQKAADEKAKEKAKRDAANKKKLEHASGYEWDEEAQKKVKKPTKKKSRKK